ncbi:aldehyde dehydrogenase family protein [Steroidobacter sp.]|uniref:aldehyde dehydrogenase family protein n=1 Tax=Steroidobacter sp. TaxID=1978227 RepID=UPI001A4D57FF|nr:aldehyde dehydrogenase family protein [Steroidobacter sp.]MBL8268446.1 aldehyde dehydrogenase family protein [Steroidobacter sp.]
MARKFEMTINGQPVAAAEYVEIKNPADGSVVGLSPLGTRAHLDSAVAAAKRAFASWRETSDEQRADACRAIAKVLADNAAELSQLLTREQGKPLKGLGSEFELGGCAGWSGYVASQSLPVKILEDSPKNRIEQHRVPIGVVGSITPWNWPLLIAIWHIVPAVRTGNTVVIKPSPFTPLSTLRMIELLNSVLPPGVINVVSGEDRLGADMSAHPDISKVVFTGSIATGKKVMASAAGTLKALTLELGGNDAGIVLPDADVEKLAEGLFWGAFINSGQTCGALKRLYVHDSVFERTCQALTKLAQTIPMGDGSAEGSLLGPLQNERQYQRVIELVEDAKAHGAKVLTGGAPTQGPGYFYPITLVTGIEDGVRLVDEEQFGPVLPIVRYTDVDDAIRRANGTDFGLDASVWGSDPELLRKVAQRLEAGTVLINKHAEIAPHVPFGGIKSSGLGVEFGQEGLEAYTTIKIINSPASGSTA